MTQRRPLALGAAAVLGFGSLFIAAPAMAEETPTVDTTASAMAAVTEINKETAGDPAVGAGTSTNGEPVVFVSDADAIDAEVLKSISAEHNVDKVVITGEIEAQASTDIVGGAGYFGPVAGQPEGTVGTCSVGFTGFDPQGNPALITAGHCSSDGAVTDIAFSDPSNDVENPDSVQDDGNGIAGAFGFSQFGGANNSPGAENDPTSTDIAVIDITNEALDLLPAVTDWTTAAQDDLAASATPIKNVGLPQSGTISKSGATTGLSSGGTRLNMPVRYTDGSTGIEEMEILDGYMQVSGRFVHGFLGGALTSPGDSGGAVFQGETAVGVVSGGPEEVPSGADDYAWYTLLQPALGFTDGYTVALDIDEPVVKTDVSAPINGGSDIVVTVPSNAKELSVGMGNMGDTIPVEGAEVSIPAPSEPGDYSYTLVAQNGFSKSEPVELNFEVVLGAPSVDDITSEESGVTLTGTGVPGAELDITVTREGADPVSLTATVNEDGTWSVPTELEYGTYTVSATQTFEDQTSAAGTGTVSVVPAAPAITSVKPGATFEAADAPSSISGTGIEGATVVVKLNGEEVGTATAGGAASESGVSAEAAVVGADGTWTIDLGAQLSAGTYTVEATQAINGATSSATSLVFNVAAAPVTPVAPVDPGAPADPSNPAAPGGQGGTGGAELVNTGTGFSMLPFGLAALGMLILGGGAIVFTQRRLQATAAE